MPEHDNTLIKSPSHTAPTKYPAAYSKGLELVEKRYCITLAVSEGADPYDPLVKRQ